ncbi:MAG: homoserine dehydrogenase, partial [Chloroflexia bacterium]|nr:homoserine dehydrogenase [Chloroflexia bacterium]
MRSIPIVQIGLGGVGRELVRQVLATREALAKHYRLSLVYLALADSGGVYATGAALTRDEIEAALAAKAEGRSVAAPAGKSSGMPWSSLA